MTLSLLGIQYICKNFGDVSFCCVRTGLSWYYTLAGTNYQETGGTAQIVSRLASGLIDSLTMTSPARGAFTKAELDAANAGPVTLQDAKEITDHDEQTEVQWCFIPCSAHIDQATCETYGCYWWNGACHDAAPSCEELNNQGECLQFGCYWYNDACHSTVACENILTQTECEGHGCYWYNGSCHTNLPTCPGLNNQDDCLRYDCFWFRGLCHSVDQPELCYWIDDQGGPGALTISNIFIIIDAYLYNTPPSGYTFIPTLQNVFGVIDYYLGFNGDAKTGCLYY